MRALPVDPVAFVASPEPAIEQRAPRRQSIPNRILRPLCELPVAAQPPAEGPDRAIQIEPQNDVFQLLSRPGCSHTQRPKEKRARSRGPSPLSRNRRVRRNLTSRIDLLAL